MPKVKPDETKAEREARRLQTRLSVARSRAKKRKLKFGTAKALSRTKVGQLGAAARWANKTPALTNAEKRALRGDPPPMSPRERGQFAAAARWAKARKAAVQEVVAA